ncbi:MAG: hypothetical protein ACAH95_09105 [Fimbriimonas sp.]
MTVVFLLLGAMFCIAAVVCKWIILIDAFQDSVLKGLACLLCCGLYMLYYELFEFEHEHKWQIVLGSWFLTGLGSFFLSLGGLTIPGR